ncbi:hypothetical protein AYJ66_06460 [Dietzia cinnamea]|nr:hypothetical protein AYJ66_06460 [Dietzia cinnamea]
MDRAGRLTDLLRYRLDLAAPTEEWEAYFRAVEDAGVSLLFIRPGTKIPDDPRPAAQRAAVPKPEKGGVYIAHSSAAMLAYYFRTLRADHGQAYAPNVAINPGRSRVVIIDADTPEEVAAWEAWCRDHDVPVTGRTTVSPGTADGHHGGGHWIFDVSGAEIPTEGSRLDVEHAGSKFSVYYGQGAYVLAPPSVRDGRAYEAVGEVLPAPAALVALVGQEGEKVREKATQRRERVAQRRAGAAEDDGITQWGLGKPWSEILPDDWWVFEDRLADCGCPIVVRPGKANPHKERSGIAHDEGCARDHDGGGYLHLFSTNAPPPLDGRTGWSKLQAMAALHYDGDHGAAMDAEGIDRGRAESGGGLLEVGKGTRERQAAEETEMERVKAEFRERLRSREHPIQRKPAFVADLIDAGALLFTVGEPGSGKTWVDMDLACHAALGWDWNGRPTRQGLVIILAGEGEVSLRNRIAAFERHHRLSIPHDALKILPGAEDLRNPDSLRTRALIDVLLEEDPVFIVIDTMNKYTAGVDENLAKEMSPFVKVATTLAEGPSSPVVGIIHHTAKNSDDLRGSGVLRGAADTILLAEKDGKGGHTLKSTKQRDREEGPVGSFALEPVEWVEKDADGQEWEINAAVVAWDGAEEGESRFTDRSIIPAEGVGSLNMTEAIEAVVLAHAGLDGVSQSFVYSELRRVYPPADGAAKSRLNQAWKRARENRSSIVVPQPGNRSRFTFDHGVLEVAPKRDMIRRAARDIVESLTRTEQARAAFGSPEEPREGGGSGA